MTSNPSQTSDVPEGVIQCPECGAKIPTAVQTSLANDPLYQKAKRRHLGFHVWHIRSKMLSLFFLGGAVWFNDFCDGVARLLFTETTEVIDASTQSFAWKWTAGWFVAPMPKVTQQVSHMYDRYSAVTTILLLLAVIWVSRWFYWTMLMYDFEGSTPENQRGSVAPALLLFGTMFWLAEYAAIGFTARYVLGPKWPSPIRTVPDWTGLVAFGVAIVTTLFLAFANTPPQQTAKSV